MARQATGAVIEHLGRDGRVYRSLRFSAYGKRRRLPLGPVSPAEAERELRHVLADVERGAWAPPISADVVEPAQVPTFDELAGQWWLRNENELRENTRLDYRWRLGLLMPTFGPLPIDQITYDTVERFIADKLAEGKRRAAALEAWKQQLEREKNPGRRAVLRRQRPPRPLSGRSINMALTLLGTILEGAVDREIIPKNPARGKKRRARETTPRRSYLDSAEQIRALLDAAGKIDQESHRGQPHRRAMLATLAFAGLRISELCALRWRDVDLASGWLTVQEAKTDAGRRKVKIRPALREELSRTKPLDAQPDSYVFATSTGRRQNPSNIRNRVLAAAVMDASAALTARGSVPLPERVTPHSLRRTFASLLCAIGEPPTVAMQEMGHTSPSLTLRVYAQAMRREEHEVYELRALIGVDQVAQLANIGQRAPDASPGDPGSLMGTGGFEPPTSRV